MLRSPIGDESLELGSFPRVASAGDSQNLAGLRGLDAAQVSLIEFLTDGLSEAVERCLNAMGFCSVCCLTRDRFKLGPGQQLV